MNRQIEREREGMLERKRGGDDREKEREVGMIERKKREVGIIEGERKKKREKEREREKEVGMIKDDVTLHEV